VVALDVICLYLGNLSCASLWGSWQNLPLQKRCLLFVLAADFLQTLINKAKDMNFLQVPIPLDFTSDFPIIQYADDTLIIMEGCARQLSFLKSLLQTFAISSGLRVNYSKFVMVPINIEAQKMEIWQIL
jgi:hypothetical protein